MSPLKLVLAVQNGSWKPPAGIPRPDTLRTPLRAARIGRSTVLIFRALDGDLTRPLVEPDPPLGPQQMAVLQCMAGGMTTKQTAARLNISRRSVYLHLAAVRRRLSAASTAEAVRRAAEMGLCPPPAASPPGKSDG